MFPIVINYKNKFQTNNDKKWNEKNSWYSSTYYLWINVNTFLDQLIKNYLIPFLRYSLLITGNELQWLLNEF